MQAALIVSRDGEKKVDAAKQPGWMLWYQAGRPNSHARTHARRHARTYATHPHTHIHTHTRRHIPSALLDWSQSPKTATAADEDEFSSSPLSSRRQMVTLRPFCLPQGALSATALEAAAAEVGEGMASSSELAPLATAVAAAAAVMIQQ